MSEQPRHGAPCFFVRAKRPLCYYHDNHRGDGRISLWCPAPPGVQVELVSAEPERFFNPPMSARGTFSAWLGVFLDATGKNTVDWDEVAAIVEDEYREVVENQRLVYTESMSDENGNVLSPSDMGMPEVIPQRPRSSSTSRTSVAAQRW